VAQGALSLSEQTVRDVMVPFEKVFMLDEDEAQPPPPPSVGRRSRPIPTGTAAHFPPCVHLLLRGRCGSTDHGEGTLARATRCNMAQHVATWRSTLQGSMVQRLDLDVMADIMANRFHL
jgi:hypothetical protein